MLNAQHERCAFMENFGDQSIPENVQKYREFIEGIESTSKADAQYQRGGNEIIQIPLHVVVVHLNDESIGQGRNISEERIMSQIEVLNDDFRRLNADRTETPDEFLDVAADTRIEFCLAAYDEDGNPTTGITRVATSKSSYSSSEARTQLIPGLLWDPTKYMNMISVRLENDLLGFAAPPEVPLRAYDGVTIGDRYFGSPAPDLIYNKGRTATHEVGHYLGLAHIWRNCSGDDGIDDTPRQSSSTGGCPPHPRPSCGSNDMFQNYMDYTNDACMNIWTQGQTNVMRGILAGIRSSLVQSVDTRCSNLSPSFVIVDYNGDEVCRGLGVNFENQSGPGAESFAWTFEGGFPETSTDENPTDVLFYENGTYKVTLTVQNAGGNETESFQSTINVVDGFSQDNLNDGVLILTEGGTGGYISGHNNYNDKAKAEFFVAESGSVLESLEINFAQADGPDASTVTINVWDADGGGNKPNTILASKEVTLSSINVTEYNTISFDSPVMLNGSFYAGFELDYTDGTSIAVYTNEDGDTDPATAWEKLSDNTWKRFDQNGSWSLEVALSIKAKIACQEAQTASPVALFSATNVVACLGEMIDFENTSLFGPTSFLWDFGDGNTSTKENPSHEYQQDGNYTVKLTVSNEQGTDVVEKSDLITIHDNPAKPVISQQWNTLSASVSDGSTYAWYLNGNLINGANTNQYEIAENGSYAVEVTDENNCTSRSDDFSFSISGVFNNDFVRDLFFIFPNPANEEVEVQIKTADSREINWELIDLTGKTVLAEQTTNKQFSINISHLNNGIYFIKIADNNKRNGIQRLLIN